MKVFITKYALTAGIECREATACTNNADLIVSDRQYFHGEGREWHRTFEDAVKRAEEMRLAKIESLEKSLAKFRALRF